ncbi:MAG: AtpZ/AtpI family protein [Deltaproteobacteria bacterium]|nr:AtpZ/AtpI family protein [Deltaproteobacteria bacterium]
MSQDSDSARPGQDSAHPTHVPPLAPISKLADPASKRGRAMFDTLTMSSVGLEFGLSVIIGLAFGRWLDSQAGTDPWLMILFIVLGFTAGIRGLMRAMAKSDRMAAEETASLARPESPRG